MSDTDKQCLFFDARGCGPSAVRLIEREIREHIENGEVIVPRAFGLCWEVTDAAGPLRFVEDGGFMLEANTATWLRDQLSAWLDAPRLAARETAEVVAQDGKYGCGYELLRSSAGEWGVLWRDGDGSLPSVHWHTDERQAREEYATERDMALCICGAECDADEIDRSGDEPQCPKCVAAAVEAFKAQRFRCAQYDCNGSPCTGHKPCGWTGTGADLSAPSADFEPYECPKCGAFSVEEIRQ